MVSIIVPIYNCVLHLEDCLRSILSQTCDDIEVVLIDDCSGDDSVVVTERIIAEYKGTKQIIFHKNSENMGSSATRNLGIELSHGEYIAFVDCDHLLCPDFVSKMLEGVKYDSNVGIVSCAHLIAKPICGDKDYRNPNDKNTSTLIVQPEEYVQKMWTEQLSHEVWGKLYKRDIFNGNKFRTDRLHAGFSFFIDLTETIISNGYQFVALSDTLYVFRTNSSYKTILKSCPKYYMEKVHDYRELIEKCNDNKLSLKAIRYNHIRLLYNTIQVAVTLGPDSKPYYWTLRKYLCSYNKKDISSALNMGEFKSFLKLLYLPHLYWHIRTSKLYKQEFYRRKNDGIFIPLGDNIEFFHIAKAGCSHLRKILVYIQRNVWIINDAAYIGHVCMNHNFFRDTVRSKKRIRFAVYIDPFRRVISTYQDKIKGTENYTPFYLMGIGKKTSFSTFMIFLRKELKKKDPWTIDVHLRPQHLAYSPDDVDIIVPIQYLNTFLKEHNIPIPNTITNTSKKPRDYSEFEKYRGEIEQLYANDYKIVESYKVYIPDAEKQVSRSKSDSK